MSQSQPQYRINLRRYRILYWPFLLPVALLIALFNKLSPVPFKIYVIRADRVGHLVTNQENFLYEIEHGLHPKEFRVYVHRDRPSNGVLLDMLKRVMPIHQAFLPLFDVCHKLGGLGVSSMYLHHHPGTDPSRTMFQSPPHLSFTKEEDDEARRQCRELGMDPDKPFVPVLGRDSAYLSHIGEPTDTKSYRNVDINTFIPAMEFIAKSCPVIRMGSVVRDRLRTEHPNVIDYSLSGKRTELLDVYLPAKCLFFLTVGTGIDSIASCGFRRPTLYVNYIPPEIVPILPAGSMCILKKYWNENEKRYMSFRELHRQGIESMSPDVLNPQGIFVHDNTPEEILESVREMMARLDGSWVETEEDRALQAAFWECAREVCSDPQPGLRVGASYLRNNRFWID
ncbi:TIGR04372 family glycosyltransferase [Pseudodesulfovibrio sp.]|uniref:TIGR04372 family glycosyltransferase n=1 Tax=Pseudodesulfovibrio sp. TaxID=2035812 RepID=UPI00261D055B|nr:TIGR04372 family glycosyltransferase [Pseudodesulfovibrio sp.]MDD3312114.1 TIGR04372 family glycosyltransferase [Pseudodesulfovibrio sp.]